MIHNKYKWILAGVVFALLWGSASTATKLALLSAQPLVIALSRFIIASLIMLVIAHGFLRARLPAGREWKQLMIYGLLNITVYLGLYVISMKHVTASIGALTVAINPVFISFFSLVFLKKPVHKKIILSLSIGLAGIVVEAIPFLEDASATPGGLILLVASMVSYSAGNIYFSARNWNRLHLLVINGWQTLFGGLFLLPFVMATYHPSLNHLDNNFFAGVIWLAIPVSVLAVACWLWLLQQDALKAGMWLFLSPVFGLVIANSFMGDAISMYTVVGLLMVLGGLALSHFKPESIQQME